jgi:hypothetical protein
LRIDVDTFIDAKVEALQRESPDVPVPLAAKSSDRSVGGVPVPSVSQYRGAGMIREVVRELRRRKSDVASPADCDAALADRYAKRSETPSEHAWRLVALRGAGSGMLDCRAPGELFANHGIYAKNGEKLRKTG